MSEVAAFEEAPEGQSPSPPGGGGAGPGKPAGHRTSFGRAFLDAFVQGHSAAVTFLAIVIALFIGALLIAFSDPNVLPKFSYFFAAPGAGLSAAANSAGNAYYALFQGAIVSPATISSYLAGHASLSQVFYPISETIVAATPLILAGLAVTIAFRAGLFNIGGQGQIVTGGLLAGWVGFGLHLPLGIHVIVALVGGIVGGAIWGWVAGWLKARTGAHEVITTIMLNYIAIDLLDYLLHTPSFQRPGSTYSISPFIAGSAHLPALAGSSLRVNAGIFVALLCALAVAWILNRSTIGFELKAVGLNPDAARTAGMSVKRVTVVIMLISGALAGLAGAVQILGTQFDLTPGLASQLGFTAITVSLLGRLGPWGTVLAAFLFGALSAGGTVMQASTGTPVDVVTVIQAVIVMFIAAPPLVRAIFRLRGARTGGEGQSLSGGWGS
ncbi:MAG: ABC transporter permease [Acidimicrobiales bacterium]